MNRIISPGQRYGSVNAPSSKSQAHRLFLAAALSSEPSTIICSAMSKDIEATISCLCSLGADIRKSGIDSYQVCPIVETTKRCELNCGESGSTLRFLLPYVGALGKKAVFHRLGRLPERPLEPLLSQLEKHGMSFREVGPDLYVDGQLTGGEFTIPGDVSSQYITALLYALPILSEKSVLTITGKIESGAYITMTENVILHCGINLGKSGNTYLIEENQRFSMPAKTTVEGDYSNAAFFLCIGALSDKGVTVYGLDQGSSQGDKAIINILTNFGAKADTVGDQITISHAAIKGTIVDASPIPDLIPVLSVIASVADGETKFINAGRLRLKESDRLQSTSEMLAKLGADVKIDEDTLIVHGVKSLHGGCIDSYSDHRIAMAAAVAACVSDSPVEVTMPDCVSKSYPRFWNEYDQLKGINT